MADEPTCSLCGGRDLWLLSVADGRICATCAAAALTLLLQNVSAGVGARERLRVISAALDSEKDGWLAREDGELVDVLTVLRVLAAQPEQKAQEQ